MKTKPLPNLEAVLAQALELDTLDKVRLIERVSPSIEAELKGQLGEQRKTYPSLWGVCRDQGPAPSIEEIEAARREAWGEFPRDGVE